MENKERLANVKLNDQFAGKLMEFMAASRAMQNIQTELLCELLERNNLKENDKAIFNRVVEVQAQFQTESASFLNVILKEIGL